MKNYYTLYVLTREEMSGTPDQWCDEFGSYDLSEIKEEIESCYYDRKKKHIHIYKHEGTTESLCLELDRLNNQLMGIRA
jgi:hypothetical protein